MWRIDSHVSLMLQNAVGNYFTTLGLLYYLGVHQVSEYYVKSEAAF